MKKKLTFLKPQMKYIDAIKNQLKIFNRQYFKKLLELEFKSNHLIITKKLKRVIKKVLLSV